MEVICPYCNEEARFTTSLKFYGRDYGCNLYVCVPCDARVGTHGKSKVPKGTMANQSLRNLRIKCHELIDQFWRYGKYSRSEVYRRLSEAMGLPIEETHIGMFNEEQCIRLISFFNK